jgi:hypothetical protein
MKHATIKLLNPRSPDTKYTGNEPTWAVQPLEDRLSKLTYAFNWYHYFYSKKDAKDMIISYLDRHDRAKDAKKIRGLSDSQIVPTVGWLCRMVDLGLQLTAEEQKKLDSMLDQFLQHKQEVVEPVEEPDAAAKPNIQDRLRERVVECAGELEGLFDDFIISGAKLGADFKPVSVMRTMNIAPQLISYIKDIWQRRLTEFDAVVAGKDSDLVAGYSHLSKIQLRNCVKFCELVLADCGSYIQLKKVERKPRKVKPITPEKRAAKFKICTEFAELALKSLPASQLVDKSEAWLYDTKKRKLIHLIADEYAKCFTIKNNNVVGYSPSESLQKTLRKPAETLKAINTGGKPAARKTFKDIKATETAWNGRGSENLVILKAW